MPIYSRRELRQRLGQDWFHDTLVSRTTGSFGVTGSLQIVDSTQVDLTSSGEDLYFRKWLRVLGSAGFIQDVKIGSFNPASGAFAAASALATTVFSGMPYEVHSLMSPADKDRALDVVIRDVRARSELPIWAIDQGHVYSLGTDVLDVLDVRSFSDPTDSLNLGEHKIRWWKYEVTATGRQLRIDPALVPSYQLIVDAITAVSLGAGDLATVNLPSDAPVLAGAAARGYWTLEQTAPGKEAKVWQEKRAEAAREYTRLSARFQPASSRRIQLEAPW